MTEKLYKVQIGAFKNKINADKLAKKATDSGFDTITTLVDDLYKVQCGAFSSLSNAQKRKSELKKAGFDAFIVEFDGNTEKAYVSDAQKIYGKMKSFIDSKSAHKDAVNAFNEMATKLKHSKMSMSDAWCTEFVVLSFYLAGMLNLIGYARASGELVETAKKNGTWKSGHDDIIFGDVVIYKDSKGNPNHTEFAIGSNDFISGNYNGGVHHRHRSSLSTVKGRIRPRYTNK